MDVFDFTLSYKQISSLVKIFGYICSAGNVTKHVVDQVTNNSTNLHNWELRIK